MVKKLLVIFVFVFVLSLSMINASTSSNITEQTAAECINESYSIMADMEKSGFNVIRINDSIKEAEAFYSSQKTLKEKNKEYDFSSVVSYCEEIKTIRESALVSKDELNALLRFYNDSVVPGMNTTEIDMTIITIKDEIDKERYEQVQSLVNSAYSLIITTKSSYTALNVFYKSTTRNLRTFLENNWKTLSILLALAIIFFLVYRIKILRWINENRLEKLKMRKKTIKEILMKTQKDYFQTGTISEGEYNIKTKKFSEMILDIDRQIPLLQENMVKLGWKPGKEDRE
jgi:uncharacterized membrane protein